MWIERPTHAGEEEATYWHAVKVSHEPTNKRERKPTTINTANNNSRPAATEARYRAVVREFDHAERVTEKKHRVEGLRALLEMHQQQREPDDQYVKGLRRRLKEAQTQLENMRP